MAVTLGSREPVSEWVKSIGCVKNKPTTYELCELSSAEEEEEI